MKLYGYCGIYYVEEGVSVTSMIDRAKLAEESILSDHVQPFAVFDDSMRRLYVDQMELMSEYETAIANEEFKVYYQPVVEATSGNLISAEALVRWVHPQRGLVSPAAFIPALENGGHISKLDWFIADRVAKVDQRCYAEGIPVVPVSVNLSWMDFYDEEMLQRLVELLKSNAIKKGDIRLEITETSYAALESDREKILEEFHLSGAKILLDDFGSGFSSFGMLKRYNFDILKLDMTFTRQIETSPKVCTIIIGIIQMVHHLGIKVIAEGAETEAQVKFLREKYPPGTRIRLVSMEDPYAPVAPGTEGTLVCVDDAGQFQMKWDNGRALALIPGEDSFTVLPPERSMLKLYMPLTAELYEPDEWGDMPEEAERLTGGELASYEDKIRSALFKNRMQEEQVRGIMYWYRKPDSVNDKVHSVVFDVEQRHGRLWGVAECQISGELSAEELAALKKYISGQASDGWGEGFEQREIELDGGRELYIHLWQDEDWSIRTEQERFEPYRDKLPQLCFTLLPGTGQLICVKRGESGYYPSDWSTPDAQENRRIADEQNRKLGVTPAQEEAMKIGSMCGWDVPGADPDHCMDIVEQSGGMELG